jgi:hypothetical protein
VHIDAAVKCRGKQRLPQDECRNLLTTYYLPCIAQQQFENIEFHRAQFELFTTPRDATITCIHFEVADHNDRRPLPPECSRCFWPTEDCPNPGKKRGRLGDAAL